MEHEEKPLPIEHRTLGEVCHEVHGICKGTSLQGIGIFPESSPAVIEALISINTRLQHMTLHGYITYRSWAVRCLKAWGWYERLGRWQEALVAYERKAELDLRLQTSKLAEWSVACTRRMGSTCAQVEENWFKRKPRGNVEKIAPMAAAQLGLWMNGTLWKITLALWKADSTDRAFYRAILSVHQINFPSARSYRQSSWSSGTWTNIICRRGLWSIL